MEFRLQNYVGEFGETILNAFDIGSWRSATSVKEVRLTILAYKGAGSVILRHISANGTMDIETIHFTGSGAKSTSWISLETVDGFLMPVFVPDPEGFEATCEFQTRTPLRNPQAKTNYISCTFRRPDYIQKNADIFGRYIEKHRHLTQSKLTIVDNGGDSGVRESGDVYVFQNKNLGGAGGFGRGMYETCHGTLKDEGFTHVCLMDDDIYLHPEMFFRNDMLVKYLKPDVHLGAPMYPASAKNGIPDRASCFGHRYKGTYHPSDEALGSGLKAANISDFLELDRNPDSTGWWWDCISVADIKKVGMPYPFFVKMDDVEYSLRLKDNGVNLVIPTSFWVLHDDFEEKYSAVMQYYRFRNRWILLILRGNSWTRKTFLIEYRRMVINFIRGRKYEHAILLTMALSDLLKGPDRMIADYAEILTRVADVAKREKNKPMSTPPKGAIVVNGRAAKKARVLRDALNKLTLNGHFLPKSKPVTIDTTKRYTFRDLGRAQKITYWNSAKKTGYTVETNSRRAVYALYIALTSFFEFRPLKPVQESFKKTYKHFISADFWQTYASSNGNMPQMQTEMRRELSELRSELNGLKETLFASGVLNSKRTAEDLNRPNDVLVSLLKDRHKGRRGFIVGNGPSVRMSDLGMLKDEITFGSNKVYLAYQETDWRPTYYTVEDSLVLRNNFDEIWNLTGSIKIFPDNMRVHHYHASNTLFLKLIDPKSFKDPLSDPDFPSFSYDLSKGLCWGSTVVYSQIQMALYMGIREIYLIGIDHSYILPKVQQGNFVVDDGERNHFLPNYRNKGEKWHQPNVHVLEVSYTKARNAVEAAGASIKNASRRTALKVFERVDFDSLFDGSSKE